MVVGVDDAPEVGRVRRIAAEEAVDLGAQGGDEAILEVALDQDVVGGDACLAGVDELSQREATRRDRDIGRPGDDRR